MKTVANAIFRLRVPLLSLLTVVTLFLAVQLSRLQVATDFSKMVPLTHEYIQNYSPFKRVFGGGNQVRVDVSRSKGPVLSFEFLDKLRQINEDVMFVKGVDRLTVRSMVSPETRFVTITEEGFDLGPVVPYEIEKSDAGLAGINDNITKAGLKGRLVSMDMKSALITADVYETGVDYLSVYRQLNEIRNKYSDDDTSIHINGFAMVVGFVNDALPKIISLFALSTLITLIILWRCFRYLRFAMLPLSSGGLSVLWSLGIAQLLGMRLDPMTTIIPFLVFAIGTSHGIQMVKRYLEECANHVEGYDAALHALAGLMVPGILSMAACLFGFLTILSIPIGAIRDLAVLASIGIACIVVCNIVVLTLVLSFFPNLLPREPARPVSQAAPTVTKLLTWVSRLAYGRNAYRVTAVSVVLLLIGFITARTLTVGDVNPGEPLLWEDSVYNRDAAKMMSDFMLGIDWLSVVVTGDEEGVCKHYDVLETMEDYEWELGKVPGVTVVISPLILAKTVNEMIHEGDIRWRVLPKVARDLAYVMAYSGSTENSEFMTMGCQSMNVRAFLSDHKGDTIRRVIEKTKEFIASHPMKGARFVLAGGNAGVMGATNEKVHNAHVPMLLMIYASVIGICVVMTRDVKGPLFIVAPQILVTIIATAFMKAFDLGLNVNTIPVASLGAGVGVDYGIYIYSRLMDERKRLPSFQEAIRETLVTTGTAVFYGAMTLAAGVLTWVLSDLKFQADMGFLTGFLFVGHMIGAMVLMPALVYLFDVKEKRPDLAD